MSRSDVLASRSRFRTAVLGLIFGSAISMAYIGRGALALIYLALELAGIACVLYAFRNGDVNEILFTFGFAYAIRFVGILHAVWLARRPRTISGYPWYSQWYALAAFIVLPFLIFQIFAMEFMQLILPAEAYEQMKLALEQAQIK